MLYSITGTQGFEEWLKIDNYLCLTSLLQPIYIYIYKCLWQKKKKSTHQTPEIQMASNTDIKVITGAKLKYLSEKINEYGTNLMFQLLDESPLKELLELEDIKKRFGNIMVNTTWELML